MKIKENKHINDTFIKEIENNTYINVILEKIYLKKDVNDFVMSVSLPKLWSTLIQILQDRAVHQPNYITGYHLATCTFGTLHFSRVSALFLPILRFTHTHPYTRPYLLVTCTPGTFIFLQNFNGSLSSLY